MTDKVRKSFTQNVCDSLGRALADRDLGEQGHQASTGVVVEESPGRGTRLSQTQCFPQEIVGVGGASYGFATWFLGTALREPCPPVFFCLGACCFGAMSRGGTSKEPARRPARWKSKEKDGMRWNVTGCCAKCVALNLIGRAQRDARSQKLTFNWHEQIILEKLEFG
jgi:hypothetical protein